MNIATLPVAGVIPDDVFIHEDTEGEPDSVDPAFDYETRGGAILSHVYETLYTYDGSKTDLIPNLATGYTISSDGMTWTFTLRDDVTFHDGTPFNASCVKYSLDRAIIMNDPNGPAWIIQQFIKGAGGDDGYWNYGNPNVTEAEAWLAMNAIEANDAAGTVVIHTDIEYVAFLAAMTYTIGAIVSPSFVMNHVADTIVPEGGAYTFETGNNDTDQLDMGHWFTAQDGVPSGVVPGQQNSYMNEYTCGTGPYMLDEWTPGTRTVLERNDNWWLSNDDPTKKPAIKTQFNNIVSETATRVLDLKGGDCDSTYVPAPTMPELFTLDTKTNVVPGIVTDMYPSFSLMYFGTNLNDSLDYEEAGQKWVAESAESTYDATQFDKYGPLNPDRSKASQDNPFTALKFRQAIAYAFDYDQYITNALEGWGSRMHGVIPDGLQFHQTDLDIIDTDTTIAKSLFEEVGWKGHIVLAYNTGNDNREAGCLLLESIIEGLDVGITMEVQSLEWSIYLPHIRTQHLGIWLVGWGPDYADPDNFADPFLNSAGTLAGRQRYANEWIDGNLTLEKTETDPAVREQLFINIENMAAADVAHIYCYQGLNYIVHQDYIKGMTGGFSLNPMQGGNYGFLPDIYKEAVTQPVSSAGFGIVIFAILGFTAVEIIRRRR
jgi:peptide/nickel transport system substrate-binding protein